MPRIEQGGTIGGVTVPPMPTSSKNSGTTYRFVGAGVGVTPLSAQPIAPIEQPSVWDNVGSGWANAWRQIPGASGAVTATKTALNLGEMFTNPLMLMMLLGGGGGNIKKLILMMMLSGGNIDPMMLMMLMGGNIDPLMLMLMMGEGNNSNGQPDQVKTGMMLMMSKNRATRTIAPLVTAGIISAGSAVAISAMNVFGRKSYRRNYSNRRNYGYRRSYRRRSYRRY